MRECSTLISFDGNGVFMRERKREKGREGEEKRRR